MPPSTPDQKQRFSETAKFLPVAFVVCNISGLYLIYMLFHAAPRLEELRSSHRALIEMIIFNVVTGLLITCYLRCILEHPGTVPEKEEDPSWQYVPQDTRSSDNLGASLQETKRTGDRRHCKWCAKYKPDRCHHCRVCRSCILKMDHHCPWIYNCVGFRNHKYFFLLLFYATVDCHLIVWTMAESVKDAVEKNVRFMTMFLLLFGETLAAFIGVLVTAFFGFHIWLMLKAMTTIEFCEKSLKRTGYDSSVYDRGFFGNICSVLGDNMLLWLLPTSTPSGRGLEFYTEELPLAKDAETAKASKREKKAAKSYGSATTLAASATPGPSPRSDPFRGLDSPTPTAPSTTMTGGEDPEPSPEPASRPKKL